MIQGSGNGGRGGGGGGGSDISLRDVAALRLHTRREASKADALALSLTQCSELATAVTTLLDTFESDLTLATAAMLPLHRDTQRFTAALTNIDATTAAAARLQRAAALVSEDDAVINKRLNNVKTSSSSSSLSMTSSSASSSSVAATWLSDTAAAAALMAHPR
jgi:nanoRNase/pAp phosphatase (c-di-AMP/oligoRNAs hydrolase)